MSDYQGPPGFTSTFAEYTDQAPQQEVRSPSGYTRETELDRAQAVIRGERTSVKQAPQGFQNDLDDFSISLERALQYSDNPQRDRYKAYASVQLADEMGLDPYFVMHNFDSVTEQRYGMSVLPEKAWTLIENDFKRGVGALSIGHLGAALMLDPDNENLFGQLQDAMAGMPDLTDQDRTFLNKAAGGIANMGPSMGATLAAGFAGAKAGGLFGAKGAAIGAVVGIAGESSTIAAGNIFADIAFMEDPRNGKPMIQSVFESAQNQKIDPETGQLVPDMEKEEVAKQFLRISRAFALGGGVASGLLDVPQMDLLTGGRVLNEIVEKNISQIATDALKDSVLKNMAAQFVITHGVNVSAEILQEELQESAEWWATEWGKRNVAEQLKIAGVPQGTIDEYLRHVKGTFEQVGPAMLFLGAPGSIRMAGMQAVVDKRSAVQGADLSWSATMDDAFANVTDIARTGEVSREAVQAAEARIDPAGKQAPIRVVEDQSGAFEVDPADEARLEAYEARGIENVPVKVTPWQATLEENMTPERLAAMNEWSIENGTIVVPSRNVIEKLAEQDPEQFQVSESGDLTFTGMDLQYTSPIMSQSEYVFEQSGMKETIAQIENRLDELEADDRQDAEEFIQATKEAARDDNYVEAYQNLRDDPLLEKFNVWFADMGMDAGYDRLVDAAIEAEQALLPAPQEVEVLAPRKDVIPMNEAAPAREEFQRVSDELASLDRIIKTPEVQAKIEELQARKAELEPFTEDMPEASARKAVEGHWPIPDKTLEAYSDRPWATEELAHRKALRATKNLYDDIATCETVADAEAYLTTGWYWETEPAGAKEAFFAALPDDPDVRQHFFEEMMDRARYKPERNMEDFLMATETDEGLSAWMGKVSRFDLWGAGFTKEMNQAISLIDRGKEVSEGMLRRIRATINKNPDKWQGIFYRAAALRDPDLSYHLQTQLDYEYIMSLEGERAAAAYGPTDLSPEGDFSYTISAITQDGVQIGYQLAEDRKIFFLGKIVVPEDLRGRGFATRSMNRIIECADRHGYQVQLTPSDAWGSNEDKLTTFYKRFGFAENAGNNYRPEVSNSMYRDPLPGLADAASAPAESGYATVYHGSPGAWEAEDGFPFGRPRLDKMGTGEGAQAFGEGLYFADEEEVSKTYSQKLQDRYDNVSLDGKKISMEAFAETVFAEINAQSRIAKDAFKRIGRYGSPVVAKDEVSNLLADPDIAKFPLSRNELTQELKIHEHLDGRITSERVGVVYKMEIPRAVFGHLLDWDKPLSEQPPAVRDALIQGYNDAGISPPMDKAGKDLYLEIADELGPSMAASDLNDQGIQGVQYLDGNSRASGDGTRNYVIWDQDVLDTISIVEQDGVPVGGPVDNSDINEMSEKQAERTLTATEEKIRALKEALTSARKEAAKAVSEARKEAKAKERAKGKERVDRLRAQLKQQIDRRDAIKKGKEQKKRLAQQIMKPAAKGINVRVRDKIEVLQGLLDPGFRSKANVEAWQQEFNTIVAKYKDEGLEALVTKYDMSPRPLNLWTPEQLQQLKEYVDGLRVSGKKYQHDLENSMREERRKVREYIIDRWNDGTPPELPPAGTAEGRKARRTGVAKTGAFWIQRPPRIFRWMEGWAEGPFFDFFVTKVNELTDKVIETTMARHAAGDAKMKELGLTWDGLGEKTTFGNLILSRDEMISVWIYMKNEKAALAVRNGNGLSDDVITMIDNDLTDAEKAWGQYMINDFAEHRGRMEKVYELYMNEHLGKEKAYFPMLRQEESWADHDKPFGDMTDQFGFRNEWKSGYANRDFTKDRVTNKAKRQGAVRLGATHVWYTQIERHEQFVNFGIHTKDMNALVETWQFKDAVQNRFGAQGQEFLRKYIQDVANPTSVKGHDALSLASRYVRKNTAIAYLGFNALTVAKQAPSIALFMRDVGPHRLLAAAGKLMTNWDNFKFIQEHDPQMASRVITKEIELLRQKEKKRGARAVSAIGNVGMKGIQFVDQMVTSIGWMAVYDKYVNTLGHEAAVRKAQMAVLETQPSARAKDLAQLYRSGELASWATMFSNQINNIFGMATFDAAAAFKNREFGRLAGITTGIGVSIFCMTLLAGWRPDDEEDETVKAFARQVANLVPLIGKDISGGIVGWDQGGISFFPVAGEMGNFVQEAAELDPEGIGKALIGVGTGVGVLAGVPVTGAKRVGEAVEARDVRELFGSAYVGD